MVANVSIIVHCEFVDKVKFIDAELKKLNYDSDERKKIMKDISENDKAFNEFHQALKEGRVRPNPNVRPESPQKSTITDESKHQTIKELIQMSEINKNESSKGQSAAQMESFIREHLAKIGYVQLAIEEIIRSAKIEGMIVDIYQRCVDGTMPFVDADFVIKFKITTGKLPDKKNELDAGFDLYTPEAFTLKPGERKLVKIGIFSEIPIGYWCKFHERSGLANKGIEIKGGVIDSSYRHEWGVIIRNEGQEPIIFEAFDRIAQFTIERVEPFKILQVSALDETQNRGGGFGSTGN